MKKFFITLLMIGMFSSVVVGTIGIYYIEHILQSLTPVDTMYLNTYGTTKILDKNNQVIYEDTSRIVRNATYEELPKLYIDGLIAVEDDQFWTSKGYSIRGMAHAFMHSRGGSTIEQQLIKNTYYNRGQGVSTIKRKIHEVFLAKQMDENLSKKEILMYYVNKLELGEGAVGIKAAMNVYFNKEPQQMQEKTPENIAQLAYLVGLGQAPSNYDLYTGDVGLKRKNIVLGVWYQQKLITKAQYQQAKAFDLKQSLAPRYHVSEKQVAVNKTYQVYTSEVLKELKQLGYDLTTTTLNVKTFLDPEVYQSIQQTVLNGPFLDDNQQVGVAVMDTKGIVVGMVGGRGNTEWNHATQQTRSSGSSLKPFTAYGPLLQYFGDQYNSASRFDSSAYLYPGTNIYMQNYGGYTYGAVDMQKALRLSLNTPVARIDDEILGSDRMKQFLSGVGLDVKETYSANDGIGLNVSPLQAAAAYNALNNGGIYIQPRFVHQITFVDGSTRTIEPKKHRAMNESVAYILTQMLRGVPQGDGLASDASIPQYAGYAGKTGSVAFEKGVNQNSIYGIGGSDAWFDSITKDGYAISVWVGYDNPNTDPQIPDTYKGQQIISRRLQQQLNGEKNISNWQQPETVKRLSGDNLNAHYATLDTPVSNQKTETTQVPELKTLPDIKQVKPSVVVDVHWKAKIPTSQWKLYEFYQENPDAFSESGILSDTVYHMIKGE